MPDERGFAARLEAEREAEARMAERGTIYLIAVAGTSHVKVGFTAGKASERLCALQVGCPYELTVIACLRGSRNTEQALHSALNRWGRHLRGEWFDLDTDQWRAADGCDGDLIAFGLYDALKDRMIETITGGAHG